MSSAKPLFNIMKKADLILIIVILLVSLALALILGTQNSTAYSESATVEIIVDGELYGTYALGTPKEIAVPDDLKNVVAIQKGKDGKMSVRMKSAKCIGQDCVHHAPIELGGQSIVCLPAKLVVKIKNGGDELDGYTY